MRLLFVVQRYGEGVVGGSELACREMATRLAARGHHVEVVTTCAASYINWANEYEPGTYEMNGVTVHRLPVSNPRDDRLFGPLHGRVWGRKMVPMYVQREWMRSQGPHLPGLVPWIEENAASFDVAIFFTYLYFTTWAGLPAASRLVPTVMHPTAHDEPPLYLPLFDLTFRSPSAIAFLTPEEQDLVHERFRIRPHAGVFGVGLDPEPPLAPEAAQPFRERFGLDDRPYLLFIGRVDPHKGSEEMYDFFLAYKKRNPGPLALAILGDPVKRPPPDGDVFITGVVDEETKQRALAGCLALIQPSYFESFSIVLLEAWAQAKPVLAQGRCAVLAAQTRRSGGGIPYWGFAEFEAALGMLSEDAGLRERLGRSGRRFVETNYAWDHVLDSYEDFLRRVIRRATPPSKAVGASASGDRSADII